MRTGIRIASEDKVNGTAPRRHGAGPRDGALAHTENALAVFQPVRFIRSRCGRGPTPAIPGRPCSGNPTILTPSSGDVREGREAAEMLHAAATVLAQRGLSVGVVPLLDRKDRTAVVLPGLAAALRSGALSLIEASVERLWCRLAIVAGAPLLAAAAPTLPKVTARQALVLVTETVLDRQGKPRFDIAGTAGLVGAQIATEQHWCPARPLYPQAAPGGWPQRPHPPRRLAARGRPAGLAVAASSTRRTPGRAGPCGRTRYRPPGPRPRQHPEALPRKRGPAASPAWARSRAAQGARPGSGRLADRAARHGWHPPLPGPARLLPPPARARPRPSTARPPGGDGGRPRRPARTGASGRCSARA